MSDTVEFTNFFDMCDDIVKHIKENNSEVVNSDFVGVELKIGFTCNKTGKVWKIKASDAYKELDDVEKWKIDLIKKACSTHDGREALCSSINYRKFT